MTISVIETTTFRFVAQHLNHCATAVPSQVVRIFKLLWYNISGSHGSHYEDCRQPELDVVQFGGNMPMFPMNFCLHL